ncbi:MAG: type II toxin-antitoxin system RelE/ParE family toxin [Magnetococcus sp. THC-1_WYH]
MVNEPKRIPARFYRTPSGHEPVREWLLSLSREDRFRIGSDLKTVEFGWPVGMPTCRPLGRGLFEVRSTLDGRIARVIFCIADGRMVLLHGFIKKTQKTPQLALNLAYERAHILENTV